MMTYSFHSSIHAFYHFKGDTWALMATDGSPCPLDGPIASLSPMELSEAMSDHRGLWVAIGGHAWSRLDLSVWYAT